MRSSNKKILVTGATGFIGTALCATLFSNGFAVRALTRKHSQFQTENYEWVVGDITNASSLVGLCDGIDIIIHLAGFAHAHEEERDAFNALHEQINHQGTLHVLHESIKAGVARFIYFSSVKACAESDDCVDETWDAKPLDVYGIAKRAAEEAVLLHCKANNIIPIILRPALVYGAGVKGNLFAMLKGISSGYFPPLPQVNNHRSMISRDDLCRATLLAATIEKPQRHIFIVTDDVVYSTSKIVHMMREALGKKSSKIVLPLWIWFGLAKIGDCVQRIIKKRLPMNTQAVNKLFSNAAYTSQYIKNELQFEPRLTLQDALPLMIAALKV